MAAERSERQKAQRIVADNRKAFHDFHVLDTFEAGIVLLGTEIKAIREGRVNLRDSYARLENGEAGCSTSTSAPTATPATRTTRSAGSGSCCCTSTKS